LAACIIVSAVAKLWKATVSFVMSVCPSLRMEHSAPTGEIFMKFEDFLKMYWENSSFINI
jgi:hypothetical protein